MSKVELVEDKLVITLSDGQKFDLGNVKGEKGDRGEKGEQGDPGVSITNVTLTAEGNLSMTFSSGETIPLGNIKGRDGVDGVGIDEIYIQDGNLYVKKTTDTNAVNLGSVKGEKGDKGEQGPAGENGVDGKSAYELYKQAHPEYTGTLDDWLNSLKGAAGRSVVKTEIINNSLVITYSDGEVVDLGGFAPTYVEGTHVIFEINLLSNNTYSITGIKNNQLEEIVIPTRINGLPVTRIASNAFEGNTSIKKVVLADSIVEIGDSAFKDCTALEAIEIGKDSELTTFSAYAFNNCTALKHIYIPKTVIFIGNYAFYNAGLETACFEDYTGWSFEGAYNGYPAHYQPVGFTHSANMLKGDTTISSKTYSFYKNNIEKSDANINTTGYYTVNVGTRE